MDTDHTAPATNFVTVDLCDDQTNTKTTVKVTVELALLFSYADGWARQKNRADNCTLTFSSMLAAMVGGESDDGAWLRKHLALRGVPEKDVTEDKSVSGLSTPTNVLNTSSSFRQALEGARELADRQILDVRHFMAAYAIVPGYHRTDFLRLRIDRRAWCLDLSRYLKAKYPAEAKQWQDYASYAPPVLLPNYEADVPKGADLMGVGREVEAFAMLIAGRKTLTPLSIGVFGGWGAGKSYFMRRMEERVSDLANAGSHDGSYCRHIAQVRFNAWHYSETNIVSSLVAQIFGSLRFGPNESAEMLAKHRADAVKAVVAADEERQFLKQAVAAAEVEQQTRRDELDRISHEIEQQIGSKQQQLSAAQKALALAQSRVEQGIADQQQAADAARRVSPAREAVALLTRTILDDPDIGKLESDIRQVAEEARWVGLNSRNILFGILVLVITGVASYAVSALKDSKVLVAAVGLATAAAPIVAKWSGVLRDLSVKGREYQKAVRARTESAVRQIEVEDKARRDQEAAELKAAKMQAEALRAEIESFRQKIQMAELALSETEANRRKAIDQLAAASAIVAERRQQLQSMTLGSLLSETVDELSDTGIYKRDLSTLARARQDLQRLSEAMEAAREEFASGRSKSQPLLDRIVLYIDDLDRCPEDKVHSLLQAVHLLLAFDLFVCVVAVDPRWVLQCLRDSPGVASNDRALMSDADLDVLGGVATPSDYLEKIFQIPLWLRPIPAGQRPAIIGALLVRHFDGEASGTAPREAERDVATTRGPAPMPGAETSSGQFAFASRNRQMGSVQINVRELEFLPRLSPLLDGNARALKRFANTYHLVKAALPDVESDTFERHLPYLYRVCMAQLAVLATQRKRARILVELCEHTRRDEKLKLGAWLKEHRESQGKEKEGVRSLATDLGEALMPELQDFPFTEFTLWLERTRRYSFYL
jgi:hypothetical protein